MPPFIVSFVQYWCLCTALFALLLDALPHPIPVLPSISSLDKAGKANIGGSPRAVALNIPCPSCLSDGADAVLDLDLDTSDVAQACHTPSLIKVNGNSLHLDFERQLSSAEVQVDTFNHTSSINVQAICDDTLPSQKTLFFTFRNIDRVSILDRAPNLFVVLNGTTATEIIVSPYQEGFNSIREDCQKAIEPGEDSTPQGESDPVEHEADDRPETAEFCVVKELGRYLQKQQELIRNLTMANQSKLYDDLKSCRHDVSCSGKTICHHLGSAIRSLIASIQSSLHQTPLVSPQRQQIIETTIADEKEPLISGIDADSYSVSIHPVSTNAELDDLSNPRNPLVIALSAVASFLGLTALLLLIRRRCCSLRSRVERLADREERLRRKHYQCLARRERWRARITTVKVFFTRKPRRGAGGDDEEKSNLIIEASAPANRSETGLECEMGIEAEKARHSAVLDDLRFAQDFVQAVLDAEQHGESSTEHRPRQHYQQYQHTPHHHHHQHHQRPQSERPSQDTRSRSSSLPSYDSEKLPDYSSQAGSGHRRVADETYRNYTPSLTDGSTVGTPESSVPDVSPRVSAETLRTMFSRD